MDKNIFNNPKNNKNIIVNNIQSKNQKNDKINELINNESRLYLNNCDNDFLSHMDEDLVNDFLFGGLNKNKQINNKKDNDNLTEIQVDNLDETLNFDAPKNLNEQDLIKREFINQLLENQELLETIDEEALLASVKYVFEIRLYKKCVNLCL